MNNALRAPGKERGGPRVARPASRRSRALSALAAALLTPSVAAADLFTEEAAAAGLDFVHFNGMSGEWYLIENLGGGVALFDYDNDGDPDVFLTQGHLLGEGKTLADALFPPAGDAPLRSRLYRNDTVLHADGSRTLRFTDVTEISGLREEGYAMGVATGDFDNDGHVDLYVTRYGANRLWRNNGDGTFTDVTTGAGVGEERLSVSAAFLDYDRDGWLDLFVANYVAFDTRDNRECFAPSSARDYCSPKVYQPLPDRLYRNRGDGAFEDVSVASRIASEAGTALGVVVADFNGDGWPDIFVANDGLPNFLWFNQRDGTFVNDGLLSGTAVNREGMAEASMGVDAADFDGDGDEDLFMTHLTGETNTLYVNDGTGWFEDRTLESGLGTPSKGFTAFGTAWFDYDNDGWLDLFIANGAVNIIEGLARLRDPYPLHQPNQLFANRGDGRLEEVSGRAGAALALSEVSRGAAFGDLDNDGDVDVLVHNNNGPVRLLVNRVGNRNPWIGLRLLDRHGRDAPGARVTVERAGQPPLWRRVRADGSYASANDPRILVGLGSEPRIDRVLVHWPDGGQEAWSELAPWKYHTLHQGGGRALRDAP